MIEMRSIETRLQNRQNDAGAKCPSVFQGKKSAISSPDRQTAECRSLEAKHPKRKPPGRPATASPWKACALGCEQVRAKTWFRDIPVTCPHRPPEMGSFKPAPKGTQKNTRSQMLWKDFEWFKEQELEVQSSLQVRRWPNPPNSRLYAAMPLNQHDTILQPPHPGRVGFINLAVPVPRKMLIESPND